MINKLKQYGLLGSLKKIPHHLQFKLNLFQKNLTQKYNYWRVCNAPVYQNPSSEELQQIENDLINLGIEVKKDLGNNIYCHFILEITKP
ncbi:MAG: hypothetical protein ACKPE1_29180 [Dolichospermum sp.]